MLPENADERANQGRTIARLNLMDILRRTIAESRGIAGNG